MSDGLQALLRDRWAALKERGTRVDDMAERSGLGRSMIYYYMSTPGSKPPTDERFGQLADAFELPVSRLREAAGLRAEPVVDDPDVQAVLLTVRDLPEDEREKFVRWARFTLAEMERDREDHPPKAPKRG